MAVNYNKANGNKLLQNVSQKNEEKLNATKVVDLPLDMIDPNPDNKKIFNMDKIEGLANSIRLEGFTGAIEVIKKPDGRYEISSGHRRVEAMKLLKRDKIPAIVSSAVGDIQKARKLLTSNINNRVLTPLDMSNCIEYYIENVLKPSGFKGNVRDECAKFFGISPTQVHRYRAIGKMIPELRQLTKNEAFPYSAFEKAIVLNEEQQMELYEYLKEQSEQEDFYISKTKIIQLINIIKGKNAYKNTTEKQKEKEAQTISLKGIKLDELDRIEQEQKDSIKYPHEQYFNNKTNEIKKSTVDFLQNVEFEKKNKKISELEPTYKFTPLDLSKNDDTQELNSIVEINESNINSVQEMEQPLSFSPTERYEEMMNMSVEEDYNIKLDDLLNALKQQTYQLKEIDYSVGNKAEIRATIKDITEALKEIENNL